MGSLSPGKSRLLGEARHGAGESLAVGFHLDDALVERRPLFDGRRKIGGDLERASRVADRRRRAAFAEPRRPDGFLPVGGPLPALAFGGLDACSRASRSRRRSSRFWRRRLRSASRSSVRFAAGEQSRIVGRIGAGKLERRQRCCEARSAAARRPSRPRRDRPRNGAIRGGFRAPCPGARSRLRATPAANPPAAARTSPRRRPAWRLRALRRPRRRRRAGPGRRRVPPRRPRTRARFRGVS